MQPQAQPPGLQGWQRLIFERRPGVEVFGEGLLVVGMFHAGLRSVGLFRDGPRPVVQDILPTADSRPGKA